MARFRYSAVTPGGKTVRGHIEGSNESAVIHRLRERGCFPTQVTPIKGSSGGQIYVEELPGIRFFHRLISGGGVRPRALSLFTRQMAVLYKAGIPLVKALTITREQTRSANLRRVLGEVIGDVEAGMSLHDGFARHPKVFPAVYCEMVRAGEVSGALDTVLYRLAEFQKKRLSLRSKVRSALMYPAVVLALASIVVGIVLVFVIPRFQEIYDSMERPLPAPTQAFIAVSEWIRSHGPLAVAMIFGAVVLIRLLRRTNWGGWIEDWTKIRIPLLGVLLWKSAIARMTRTLATMLDAGVPILEALETVSATTGNRLVGKAVVRVRAALRQGENLADAMRQEAVLPSMLVHMVSVGEEAGALDTMLGEIADVYEQEVDDLVNGLTDILEPLAIVALGIVIGAIVIALYYPIFGIPDLF
jgi:type IV pilus assembly protein PilC